ncbi:MAG: molybdopterin synthase catalytic subunit [Flavobacteriales bacterium]|jgi:molybdopterin synthase catalytic subunit
MKSTIRITDSVLDPEECRRFVADNRCGGQTLFAGAVRDNTEGKKVEYLEYEAYIPMAEKELARIINASHEKWPVVKVAVHHRIGTLHVGELAVVVAVSAAHRQAAFEACMYLIDELKKDVPIWKKEFFEDGEVVVSDRA